MKESDYQKKIIKGIEDIGGIAINGKYTKDGTADLICGYPEVKCFHWGKNTKYMPPVLLHLHVEVKTKDSYEALMRNNITEVDGFYVCDPKFKGREVLQSAKLNDVRRRGGLALFAYNIKQVKEYVNGNK